MTAIRAVALVIALNAASALVGADAVADENWLLYERGNAALSQGEFGAALNLFKQAILKAGIFPEAEMQVGDIYMEEGEPDLAIAQYDKAYNERKSFMIPDMQYDVLYKAAKVCESLEQYNAMEDRLNLIVQDDRQFTESETFRMRSQIVKNFYDKGLDRVLVLYTLDQSFAAPAHATLGWFYYRTGRYDPSVSQLLYATIYRVSQMVRYLHDRDVDYVFTTVSDLLASVAKSKDLVAFARETDFYKDLYYLAGSGYATGAVQEARALWTALAASAEAGVYQELSKRQLKSPFLEPLLVLSAIPAK
jgi:tetratricopeptide (TPR) repeat protein